MIAGSYSPDNCFEKGSWPDCMPINPTASICSTAEADLRVLICTQFVTHNFSQLVLSRCCAAVRCVSLGMRSLQLVEVQVIHIISSWLAYFCEGTSGYCNSDQEMSVMTEIESMQFPHLSLAEMCAWYRVSVRVDWEDLYRRQPGRGQPGSWDHDTVRMNRSCWPDSLLQCHIKLCWT